MKYKSQRAEDRVDGTELLLIFVGVLVLALILTIVRVSVSDRMRAVADKDLEVWLELSRELDIPYDKKKNALVGQYWGRQIVVDRFTPLQQASGFGILAVGAVRGQDQEALLNIDYRIRVRIEIQNPTNTNIMVERGKREGLEKVLFRSIQTGIKTLDQNYQVESNPPGLISQVFSDPALLSQYLELGEQFATSLVVDRNQLNFQVDRMIVSPKTVIPAIDLACRLADEMERHNA